MEELIKYEIVKLCKRKIFLMVSMLLIICNVFMAYAYEKSTDRFFYIYKQRECYNDFLSGNKAADISGYYQNEADAQAAYAKDYFQLVNEMQQRSEKMQEVSFFLDENSYVYRNLIKSNEDFYPLLNIVIKSDNCYGIDAFAQYNAGIVFLLIFLAVLSYYVMFWERDKNLVLLLKCNERGHVTLAAAKLFTILAASAVFTVMLEGSIALTFGIVYGYGDLDRTVQSSDAFRNCTYMLTVREALIAMMLIRICIAAVFICIFFAVGMLLKNAVMAACVSAAGLLAEYAFSKVFSLSGTFGIIKSVNPFYCWDMQQVLGEYYNLNILGYPIGKNKAAFWTALMLIVVFSSAGIYIFHKTCQIKSESRIETLFQYIRGKMSFLSRHLSLTYYELYKVMFQQKKALALVLLLFWWFLEFEDINMVRYYGSAETAAYHVYLSNLEGAITEDTYDYIENEAAYIESLREAVDSGDTDIIDRQVYDAYLKMHEDGFAKVQKQLEELEKRGGDIRKKYMVDELAYMELWQDSAADVKIWFAGTALLIFFISGIYTVDEKKDMALIIRSTLRGRKELKRSKHRCVAICACMIYVIMESPLLTKYYMIDHFSTAKHKLCDFTTQNFSATISIGAMLALVFVLRALSFMAVCGFGQAVSRIIRNETVIIFIGIGVAGICALIAYHFNWSFNMIFLIP